MGPYQRRNSVLIAGLMGLHEQLVELLSVGTSSAEQKKNPDALVAVDITQDDFATQRNNTVHHRRVTSACVSVHQREGGWHLKWLSSKKTIMERTWSSSSSLSGSHDVA